MKPWYFRHARTLIYAGTASAVVGIAGSSVWGERDVGQALVNARQLYGLWSLALLLASMLIGPLTAVMPWLPFKASLMYGRRAMGLSALALAVLHVAAYFGSVLRRDWRELYTPGPLWVAGLIFGLLVFADMAALGITSRDASVKRMGGRAWKRLHRTVYVALCVVLVHALFVGADFGLARGPDVRGHPDFGSLIALTAVSILWVTLWTARRLGWG